jgi:hypothetical protein
MTGGGARVWESTNRRAESRQGWSDGERAHSNSPILASEDCGLENSRFWRAGWRGVFYKIVIGKKDLQRLLELLLEHPNNLSKTIF